jgi:hypothetical protein
VNADDGFTCSLCGKLERHSFVGSIAEIMKARGVCFHCGFWIEKIESPDPHRAIIEGHHYSIGDEGASRYEGMRGFGGRRYVIRKLATGEVIVTTNLWYQGEIPKRFRKDFADDAEFVRD